MEYLKEYVCQQELKSPILHTDKIIQGTPCIERIEYTKVNFSMNNMKDEIRQSKSNLEIQRQYSNR